MTTQISPSTGAGVLLTQQGTGTTPGYSALDIRRLSSGALQEGVYGTATTVTAGGVSGVAAADFMVTQRAAGANLSVDINMPGGGMAFVQGDTIAGQGLYAVPVASSNINEAIAAADLTDPRVDQVILEVQDNVLDASGGNLARTRVLTGTPTAGATIDGRQGAAALPGSALLLADVLVPANATTVPNSNIRDRRKWARGAFCTETLTSGDVSTTSSGLVPISSTLLARVECSGAPLRVTLSAIGYSNTVQDGPGTGLNVDGVAVNGTTQIGACHVSSAASVTPMKCGYVYEFAPGAGSHLLQPTFSLMGSGGSGQAAYLNASASHPIILVIEELVRATAVNNAVTSG